MSIRNLRTADHHGRSLASFLFVFALLVLTGPTLLAGPVVSLQTAEQFQEAIASGRIVPTELPGDDLLHHYPDGIFAPATLLPYWGPIVGDADGGLVMAWGNDKPVDYYSQWKYVYDADPDLGGTIVSAVVHPPMGINSVSLAIFDAAGLCRTWAWNVGPGGLTPNAPITLRVFIKPSSMGPFTAGPGDSAPQANSYFDNGVNTVNITSFGWDENGNWRNFTQLVPGTNQPKPWNYWDKVQVQTPVLEWDAGNTFNDTIDNGNGNWNTFLPPNAVWRPNLGTFGALEPPVPGNLNTIWVNGRDAALGVGNSVVTINEMNPAGGPGAVQINTLTTYANTQTINAAAPGNDVDLLGRTMNISGNTTINAVLTSSSSNGLAKYGPAPLTLTNDNTLVGQASLLNGTTVLQNNGNATVGRLPNVTNLLIQQGAALRIDNTVGSFLANENNRIFGGGQEACFLRLGAGKFEYKGRPFGPWPNSNEAIFLLSLEDGGSQIVLNNPAANVSTNVRFMNYQRFPAATLTVDTTVGVGAIGGGPGSPNLVFPNPASQPLLVIGPHVGAFTPPTQGIGIIPYMVVSTPRGLDFATYTATGSGVVTAYSYLPGPWPPGPGAQEIDPGFPVPPGPNLPWNNTTSADYNVLVTNATIAPFGMPFLNNNHVINSLKLQSGAPVVNIAGCILSLYSGGMIMENGTVLTDMAANLNSGLTAGGFIAGNAAELVVHVPAAATATISSRICDNAEQGQVSLVKSALGTLVLAPPMIPGNPLPWTNGYTGKTYVNEGVLQVTADDLGAWGRFAGGPGSDLRIQCGELHALKGFLLTRDVWFDGRAPYQQGLDKGNAGTIRIADLNALVIPTDALQGAAVPTPRMTDGIVRLTSDYTPTGPGNPGPITPLLNGLIDLQTRQANLITPSPNQPFGDTIMLEDVVIQSAADCVQNFPLGQARIYIVAGSRATTPAGFISASIGGDNNNVTRLILSNTSPNKTLPNTVVLPDVFNHFYIDGGPGLNPGGGGNSVLLTGDMERQNYHARVGEIVSANDTKLILDRQNQCNYTGAAGVGAASGEIEVHTANYWLGMLDNRGLNHLGIVTGARAQGDRNQNPANLRAHTVWFRNNLGGGPADGQFYYSTLVSESQAFNTVGLLGGPKTPLTLDIDPLANVTFTGNANRGSVLTCYDDVIKTGLGTLTLLFSGNTAATEAATKANNAVLDIQQGTVVFQDTKDAAGNYLPASSAGAPGSAITDCLFDGGNDNPQGVPADGVLRYVIRDTTTLSAQFGNNASGNGHTMHFDLTLNPATPAGVATIQVGDVFAAGQSRQPLTIGNAPFYAGFSTPALNWTGTLLKTGLGELRFDGARTPNITAGATLNIVVGTVTAAGSYDPFTDTAAPATHVAVQNSGAFNIATGTKHVASISGTGTTNVAAGATLLVGSSGDVSQGAITLTGTATLNTDTSTSTSGDVSVTGTGGLTVNTGGTLKVKGDLTVNTGTITAQGATFIVKGSVSGHDTFNVLTSADVGSVDGNGSTSIGTTTNPATLITEHVRQNTLTINADSTVTIDTMGGASGTSVVNFLQIANSSGGFNWGSDTGVFVPAGEPGGDGAAVPEPTTWLLLAVAALSWVLTRRRSC